MIPQHITILDPEHLPDDFSPEETKMFRQLRDLHERHLLDIILDQKRVTVQITQPSTAVLRSVLQLGLFLWTQAADTNACRCVEWYKLFDAKRMELLAKTEDMTTLQPQLDAIETEMRRYFGVDAEGRVIVPQPPLGERVEVCPNLHCGKPRQPSFWRMLLSEQTYQDVTRLVFYGELPLDQLLPAALILKAWLWNPIALPEAKKKHLLQTLKPVIERVTLAWNEFVQRMPSDNWLLRILFIGNNADGTLAPPTAPLAPPPEASTSNSTSAPRPNV